MEGAFAEMISATTKTVSAPSKMKSAPSKTISATSKMILEDGFGAKNGKKPGFLRGAGTERNAGFNGTGCKHGV